MGAGLSSLVLLSGCAGDGPSLPKLANLNPFAEKAVPLPGKRIAVMQAQGPETGELADASAPIILPAPRVNDAWAQPGGEPNNAPGNLAFGGAANVVWSADAGTGSGSVAASPPARSSITATSSPSMPKARSAPSPTPAAPRCGAPR